METEIYVAVFSALASVGGLVLTILKLIKPINNLDVSTQKLAILLEQNKKDHEKDKEQIKKDIENNKERIDNHGKEIDDIDKRLTIVETQISLKKGEL